MCRRGHSSTTVVVASDNQRRRTSESPGDVTLSRAAPAPKSGYALGKCMGYIGER